MTQIARHARSRLANETVHLFRDPGEAIYEPDYRPRSVRDWSRGVDDPERHLAAAFARLGKDYGGPLNEDFVLRHRLSGSRD